VSLPTNEIFIRMLEALALSVGAFLAGVAGISILRRSMVDGGGLASGGVNELRASSMIQAAKQRQFELKKAGNSEAGHESLRPRAGN
jgi:hypothetical protein